ncbi:FAD-binding domain-containing protein [Aspergillus affinis]|uniref:FAD-binding domain-containing protein n=1 Tax=Aspergillus affinis TaxID=1070780 RepID=UPI0022FEA508|nr:FAD-binding domain-containing protein [Aspergillus affinis]KAI9038844.1 FAD-binding domain-containing protein [Aspergillus affinis]
MMAHSKSSIILFVAVHLLSSASARESCTLDSFNTTLGGRVHPLRPLSLPCFSQYNGTAVASDQAACQVIQSNYSDPLFRSNSANGFMYNQVEACASDASNQCLLDNTDPTNLQALGGDCRQGNVPSLTLEIQRPEDVAEAFKFSRCSGTRLSIKNSGHDFLGRSSGQGTLSLWTRHLQSMHYNSSFSPTGCSVRNASTYNTITVEAGVNFDEVYTFANAQNVTFIGGYSSTVGVSGGWVQTGGHSILSPVYGLGIDHVVEYKIVTPDGHYRIANECQNQDLFWALRGGGGGTFGVVLESTHRVEPRVSLISASIKFPLKSNSSNVLPFLDILVNNTVKWAHEGWGGHINSNSLINVTPLLSLSEAKESLADVVAYAKSQGGTAVIEEFSSWYGFYEKYVAANAVTVGNTHFAATRLIPQSVFETARGRADLMNFFSVLLSKGGSVYIPVVGPLLYKDAKSTSATPAWREAIWSLGADGFWAWNSTLQTREQKVDELKYMTGLLEDLSPGSGAYSPEANPFTEDWQEAWWGSENYGKLLKLKQKYDPQGLLHCWKCVGWEDADAKSSCWAAFD